LVESHPLFFNLYYEHLLYEINHLETPKLFMDLLIAVPAMIDLCVVNGVLDCL